MIMIMRLSEEWDYILYILLKSKALCHNINDIILPFYTTLTYRTDTGLRHLMPHCSVLSVCAQGTD